MAALAQLAQVIEDVFRDGKHFSITKVVRADSGSTDTIAVPGGVSNAAHVTSIPEDSGSTALTIDSRTQADHPGDTSITVSAGTTGATYFLVVMHLGNSAGL